MTTQQGVHNSDQVVTRAHSERAAALGPQVITKQQLPASSGDDDDLVPKLLAMVEWSSSQDNAS